MVRFSYVTCSVSGSSVDQNMYEGLQTSMQTFMQEHTYTPADWGLIPVSMGCPCFGNAIT
jgi:hypothetical protein